MFYLDIVLYNFTYNNNMHLDGTLFLHSVFKYIFDLILKILLGKADIIRTPFSQLPTVRGEAFSTLPKPRKRRKGDINPDFFYFKYRTHAITLSTLQ